MRPALTDFVVAETCVDCSRGKYQGYGVYVWVPNPSCPDGYRCREGGRRSLTSLQDVGNAINSTRRQLQIGYHGSDDCTFGSFDGRIEAVNGACCDQDDQDDVCDTGNTTYRRQKFPSVVFGVWMNFLEPCLTVIASLYMCM